MAQDLSDRQLALLREAIRNQAAESAVALTAAESGRVTPEQRRYLIDLVGAEFARSGVGLNDEPTQRGLELERLLDVINRPLLSED